MVTVPEINDFLDGLKKYKIPFLLKSVQSGKWLKASSSSTLSLRPKDLNSETTFLTNVTATSAEPMFLDEKTKDDVFNGSGYKLFSVKNFRGQTLRKISNTVSTVANRNALIFAPVPSPDITATESVDFTLSYKDVDSQGRKIYSFGLTNINDIETSTGTNNDNQSVPNIGIDSNTQPSTGGWGVYIYIIMDPNDPAIDNSVYNTTTGKKRWANVNASDSGILDIENTTVRKVPSSDKIFVYNDGEGYYADKTFEALAFIDKYRDYFYNGDTLGDFNDFITGSIDIPTNIVEIKQTLSSLATKLNEIKQDTSNIKSGNGWLIFASLGNILTWLFLISILVIVVIILFYSLRLIKKSPKSPKSQ